MNLCEALGIATQGQVLLQDLLGLFGLLDSQDICQPTACVGNIGAIAGCVLVESLRKFDGEPGVLHSFLASVERIERRAESNMAIADLPEEGGIRECRRA